MKPKFLIPFILFFLAVLGLEIYAEHLHVVTKDFTLLAIMQPLLLPGLILYLLFHFKGKMNIMSGGVLAGLCFDWVGDIILTAYHDAFNMPSMFAYFAGHVCYAIAFGFIAAKSDRKLSFINRLFLAMPAMFYIGVFYFFLSSYMSTHHLNRVYLIPAGLYTVSIMFMAISALWRMGTTSVVSYWTVTAGALFYMLSDTITGYNHFVEAIPYKYVATMGTYGIALLLFTIGTIMHSAPRDVEN